MKSKRIAIVGGGFAGIGCVSHLKAEGLEPVCFERSNKVGGTWCYRKETRYGQSSIMSATTINHSKEMGAISNFPPRKEFSNYMKHTELYQYILDYMEKFDCEKYIRCNSEVILVKKAEDYEETGRWSVTWKDLKSAEVFTEMFDGVLVATGQVNMPNIPKFPGQDIFAGKIMHSHALKEVEEFVDQNVVVVGTGNSALDAAVEISRVAKQVYLSTRSGAFIFSRVGRNGYPIDYLLVRRYLTFLLNILPISLVNWYLETFYIDWLFDHRLYYVKPKNHVLCTDPILNDHIASKLLSGSVIQKANIHHFTENGIVFENDSNVTSVDAVIMATGYKWGFPVLEEGILQKEDDGRINLYKCMYPVQLPHPTLAILGFFYPFGPGFPVGELQVRWATYLLATNGKLPSSDIMLKDVIKRHNTNVKRYYPSTRTSIKGDFVQYMDELAEQMGVKPNLLKYMLTDFSFFLRLLFGPCLSYQYRLEGHGKWEGARDAIMTCNERVQYPLTKNKTFKNGIMFSIFSFIFNFIPYTFSITEYKVKFP